MMKHQVFFPAVLSAVLSAAAPSSAFLNLDIAGGLGYYIMPGEISGNVDGFGGYSDYGAEIGVRGYEQNTYKYRQRLSGDIKPNGMMSLRCSFPLTARMTLGLEWDHSFSFREQESGSAEADTFSSGGEYYIPYSYYTRTATVESRNYVKADQMGVFLEYRLPFRPKLDLVFGAGFGFAEYAHLYRSEYTDVREVYYQAGGNPIYTDSADSYFNAFALRYTSFYFKPSVAALYRLGERLCLRGGFSTALSYVEKGYLGDEESNNYYLYPSNRFTAGDMALFLGIRLEVGNPRPARHP